MSRPPCVHLASILFVTTLWARNESACAVTAALTAPPATATTVAPAPARAETSAAAPARTVPAWIDKVELSGILSGDFRSRQHGNLAAPGSRAISDLYIRELDLAIDAGWRDWAAVTAVLNSEWIGDTVNPGDEKLAVDEVHLDLQAHAGPYLVFGKRTQPFGLFESYLVTDPLTQDGYETRAVGATLGYRGGRGLDMSFTPYKGSRQMDQLFTSAIIDTSTVRRSGRDPRTVDSWIAAATLAPSEHHLTLLGALLSEDGSDRRNITLNAAFNLAFPTPENFVLAVEYMRGLQRETYAGAAQQFHDSALSVTGTYLFVRRERHVPGNGNYHSRKLHIHLHPVEAAVRYEHFDDDGLSAHLQAWTIESRSSLGGRYTLYEYGKISVYSAAEFRRSTYRAVGRVSDRNREFYARLGSDF